MPNNDETILEAFNNCAKALVPATADADDMLGAIRHLVDALTTFAAANTGDQTVSLTGDVTGSGAGSFAATIGASKVTAAKIANTALKLLTFTAADASVTAQSVTLTGAKVGDVVIGIVNMTDESIVTSHFESTITIVDKIQQAETNLATKNLFILILAKGA